MARDRFILSILVCKGVFFLLALPLLAGPLNSIRSHFKLRSMRGTLISASAVAEAIQKAGRIDGVMSGGPIDSIYEAPSVRDIRFLLDLAKNDRAYKANIYDCDDFAGWFKSKLQQTWYDSGHSAPLPIALVYGFIVTKDGEQFGHAWNAIVTDTGKLVFIEPQGPMAITLHSANLVLLVAIWV